MTTDQTISSTLQRPLRLWPGVVALVLQWLAWFVVPAVFPGTRLYGLMAGALAALVIVVWWLFFSRAPWPERVAAIMVMPIAVVATKQIVHASIANALIIVLAIPVMSLALVAWAAATRRFSSGLRRASLVPAMFLACGVLTLLRTGGTTADAHFDLHWRWTPTPEQRLLAQTREEPVDAARSGSVVLPSPPAVPATPAPTPVPTAAKTHENPPAPPVPEKPAIWPGFRGPNRDDVIRGVQFETDWSKSPPVELWRRPIGPGWSSFAVRGGLVYTQEQRGDDEDVSCYNLTNGKLVWRHRDSARFWEPGSGAGPRGTPTVVDGRVYTFGATGIVNALDANTGAVVWSRNAQSDTGAKIPEWGFSSSPLVVNDVVIVAASGRLVAYDVPTGTPRWFAQTGGGSYSSPHLMTIGGVAQVVMLSGAGVTSVTPANGAALWKHTGAGAPILQPAQTSDGDVLIAAGDLIGGVGTRRLTVARGSGGWTVQERWTSLGLKPFFNDFVVHKGHAFGFDGGILACIDLDDGTRKWKGGRYGHGQLLLLPDQNLLLVLSEEGELALVKATPDQFTEVARFPAALEGKTWNHPVVAGDVLLVRNDHEMAAFRLTPAARSQERPSDHAR
jgi:outer membrane protein assembly factor BamB